MGKESPGPPGPREGWAWGLSSPPCSSSPGPVSAQAVAVGQVSSLKMVVQLLILPIGFGRFFPRWQMVRKRASITGSTSGNDPRRRTTARNLAYIDGEPESRQEPPVTRFGRPTATRPDADVSAVHSSVHDHRHGEPDRLGHFEARCVGPPSDSSNLLHLADRVRLDSSTHSASRFCVCIC
jgi:hypothetical protein